MSYKIYAKMCGLDTFEEWFQRKYKQRSLPQRLLIYNQSKYSQNVEVMPVLHENIHKLISSELQFLDYDFPGIKHDQQDLYQKNNEKIKYEWKSLGYVYPGIKLFNQIQSNDIYQKHLNDCYYLASLSAIADMRPSIIQGLFKSSDNIQRKYVIELIIGGQKKWITLDDYVPFQFQTLNGYKNYTTPLYGNIKQQRKDMQIWVMLLQKAWAKASGGYHAIQWGDLKQSFAVLTGAHTQVYKVIGSWEIMKQAAQKRYPMIVSSIQKLPSGKNVIPSHAYTILGVRQGYSNIRLVRLRNPFGHTQPDNKIAFRGQQADDGIFQMQYHQFQSYFDNFSVVKVVQNASYTSQSIKNKNAGIIRVKADKKELFSISISTLSYRSFSKKQYKDQPKITLKQLSKIDLRREMSYHRINLANYQKSQRFSCEMILEAGENYIYFQKQPLWPSQDYQKKILNFGVYGQSKVEIEVLAAQ